MKKEDYLVSYYFQQSISCSNAIEKLFYDSSTKSVSSFLMHFSIEFFLKGCLTYLDITFKKTHDLVELAKKTNFLNLGENIENALKKIDTYFEHRYFMDKDNLRKISEKLKEIGDPSYHAPLLLAPIDLENFRKILNLFYDRMPDDLKKIYNESKRYLNLAN